MLWLAEHEIHCTKTIAVSFVKLTIYIYLSLQLESQEDAKLSQILCKQKLHQQQLQSPRQQNSHLQSPVRLENSLLNNLSADSFASSGQITGE